MWDPQQYLVFADQRARPFHDLVARVRAEQVGFVADLGCGPGELTAGLAGRWPGARVVGVDSSAAMIQRAREHSEAEFIQADLREWAPDRPVDVLLSNATLQWVPGHMELLPQLASFVAPGGWFAFQLPGNFGEPAHVQLRELAATPPWNELLDVSWPMAHDPVDYLSTMLDLGFTTEVWETTYLHMLEGPDSVLEWLRGSALGQVVGQLDELRAREFAEQYRARLRGVYPVGPHGTVLRYRRIFVVAHRPG
ncbi:methyltransferase domain-containing protein [Phytoactinopolyspora sp. XMNu-373]|uniref:Methyltransferase domain-containing protein n=2 Tax=Phytoactinopolyspora mesophila TaxID=2650750 RepID=A0A7K3M5A3_9ACTN|nr:methyltransferase domain-containing protein [Phytoactinopolyspora mesophila]